MNNISISEKTQDLIVRIAIYVILYLIFAKPIFNWLGITKSKNDRIRQKEIDDPNSPFLSDFYVRQNARFTTARNVAVTAAGKKLYDAFGLFGDDEPAITASFKMLKTQCEVSLLAQIIEAKTGKDLLTWLMKGKDYMPQNGISDYDLGVIINYVKRLKVK